MLKFHKAYNLLNSTFVQKSFEPESRVQTFSETILSAMYSFAPKTTNVHVAAELRGKFRKFGETSMKRENARHNAQEIEFPCISKLICLFIRLMTSAAAAIAYICSEMSVQNT